MRFFIALAFTLSAFGADPAALEDVLEIFLRSDGLLALGAQKPIALVGSYLWKAGSVNAQKSPRFSSVAAGMESASRQLKQARLIGEIQNRDITFMFHPETRPGNPESAGISLLNLPTLERLVHDEAAMQVLTRTGIPRPKDAFAMAALYRDAIANGGTAKGAERRYSTIIGIGLGYSPESVQAYSNAPAGERRLLPIQTPMGEFFALSQYAIPSNGEGARDLAYLQRAERLAENYAMLRRNHVANLEIFNRPELLQSPMMGGGAAACRRDLQTLWKEQKRAVGVKP